jgi:hypothetical protein
MARANLASRVRFSGFSSHVQYGRFVRCDRLNAVGTRVGPVTGVGRRGGETGKVMGRSSVKPANLGRDNSLRMTGCARARGDLDTLCVDGDTGPDARVIGGRRVGVPIVGAGEAKAGDSVLPILWGNRPVKGKGFELMFSAGRSASVK